MPRPTAVPRSPCATPRAVEAPRTGTTRHHEGMDERAETPGSPTLPVVRLSPAGQTYVAVVGLLAALSTMADGRAWYVVLVLLTLPLAPVALWIGFYAA